MDRSGVDKLTTQERTCLRLVPLRNTAEIARITGLSPATVKTYLHRAREKLGVTRTSDAVRALLAAEGCPPEGGSTSQATDAYSFSVQGQGQQQLGQSSAEGMLHEERSTFSPAHRSPAPARSDGGTNDRHGLTTLLKIVGLVIAVAVMILLAEPLSQSAQKLANLISPP